jgi:mono/diheme cytochrome c family protein
MSDDPKLRIQQRRESDEPEELHSPVPWPIALFSIAMIAWGTWYYFQNTGYPVSAGDRRTPIPVVAANDVDGGVVYAGNCAACHQATGLGLSGVFPPLAGSDWVLENDARLVQILLHGIQGELIVNDVTYNGVMPAFSQLSDPELAAVLTHIRSSWGNDAPPITPAQVAEGRIRFPDRAGPWQGGAELDATFPPDDR